MATKTRKSVRTPFASQQSQTSITPQGSNTKKKRTSLNPTAMARMQVKRELQNVNDRSATYSDRVPFLESENNRLSHLHTSLETITREVNNINNIYKNVLKSARQTLDEYAKHKAQFQIELSNFKQRFDEMSLTRMQEKLELQNLSDCLGAYVDRVPLLDSGNNELSQQVHTSLETITCEVNNIKTMYQNDLKDARETLDDTDKDKAQLQMELSDFKQRFEEMSLKLSKAEKELAAKNKLNQTEDDNQKLQISKVKQPKENFKHKLSKNKERSASQINNQTVKRKYTRRSTGSSEIEKYGPDLLPPGWNRQVVKRKSGKSAGQIDVYFVSPEGKRLRSQLDVAAYCVKNALPYSADDFCFRRKAYQNNMLTYK